MDSGSRESHKPESVPLREVAVHIHPRDDVAIAKMDLQPGTTLEPTEPTETPLTVRR